MRSYNMIDDFSFIYPKKVDLLKNKERSKGLFEFLKENYCLVNVSDNGGHVDFITLLDGGYLGIKDGEVKLVDEIDLDTKGWVLKIVRQQLYKKMEKFNRLKYHHYEVIRHHPHAGFLCFSIDVDVINNSSFLRHDDIIKKLIKRIFNNMRSQVLFSHVISYFWVLLRNRNGYPYIHFNFYIDDKEFNHVIGDRINDLWFSALENSKRSGSVRHFTVTKVYTGASLTKGKGKEFENIAEIYQKNPNSIIVISDYNNHHDSSAMKCATNSGNKKIFIDYIYSLAKESFILPGKSKAIGFSKVRK
ncbi:hypothetical protein [Serratia fonticola]|uniref:hypothetical protein n=1 Tax=Serratia fonticola TaxID=47917 RepID=UPI00217C6804|nr:hypothetical protein [Serratia fonticola]CAI1952154.1 Uncharacterised protein [Serratia fonticola]